jgi:SAM-dependent methyltransferase
MAKLVDDLGALQPSDDVLEIGCGPGALAAELAPRLGPGRRYVGFDVHAPSIEWCRSRFAGDPRLVFELVRARSAYATRTGPPVSSIRFPMEDGAAGHVVAKSVFTHLFEEDARHYLGEIARVLRRGRGAVVTAFLFDPAHSDEVSRAFPRGDGAVRWRSGLRPEAGVAYELSRFQAMTVEAGLRIVWMSRGYFPGAARATGQDVLLLGY